MNHELLHKKDFRGRIEWMGIASESRGAIQELDSLELVAGQGIQGEHHFGRRPERQVTLIQKEHITAIEQLLGKESIPPELFRRNIVVSGINLASLIGRRFQVGDVILEGTKDCPPCKRMEENLGTGGYEAMVSHGGIAAGVVVSGQISKNDEITARLVDK